MNNLILLALCALFSAVYVMADCPNSCSSHGTCIGNTQCLCYPDYGDADCSVRSCPYGVNPASGEVSQCSGRGSCDQKNGDCKCDAGFEGEDCSRASCPNDCSGHGKCSGTVQRYCTCDFGYSGFDCSSRQCPRGDDPLTTETYPGSGKEQQDEVQEVKIELSTSGYSLDGQFVLTFEDSYGGSWTTRPIKLGGYPSNLVDIKEVEDIIEALPNQAVPDVTVSATSQTDSENKYAITFNSAANSGDVKPLTCSISGCDMNGCQPRYTGALKKKVVTAYYPGTTQSLIHFFGDTAAEIEVTTVVATNSQAVTPSSCTGTACTVVTFVNSPFDKDNFPQAGATVQFQDGANAYTTATTVVDVDLTGKVITLRGGAGFGTSAITAAGNFKIKFKNTANTIGYAGAISNPLSDIMGTATIDAAKAIETEADGFKISSSGTGIDGIDLRTLVGVDDVIVADAAFFANAQANVASLTVTAVTATKITVSKTDITAVSSADVITATGTATKTFADIIVVKHKNNLLFGAVSAGDSIEFSGTSGNNKLFSVASKSNDGRSITVNGNVFTEKVSADVTSTSRLPAGSSATCSVSEVKKGTKENTVCSGRGSCDGSAGACLCYAGYTGESCNKRVLEM